MKLYLVRHGDSTLADNDDERPLSEQGRQDIQQLARVISPLHIKASQLFYSKKRRARETAEILISAMTLECAPQARAELDPMASVFTMVDEISTWKESGVLVGHMPYMSKLVSELIMGDEDKNIVAFYPGTMTCLERVEDQWIIDWVVNPECG